MARSPIGAAKLDAIAAAKRVHRALDLERRVSEIGGQIDIFEAIAELDIALIFKPLTSALGFCLPAPNRGIMVTTLRTLHIQRFTAAHELGHVILEHSGSVDREGAILARNPFAATAGELKEVQAEAFSAEFLLPRWLYLHHARTQGWGSGHLRNPDIVYQLSLRMGASYTATCWGLLGHQLLPSVDVKKLAQAKIAALKSSAGKEFKPGSSWADVWLFTHRDSGAKVSGNPDDLLRFDLDEMVDAGYEWDLTDLARAGYEVLADQSDFPSDPLLYGAPARRTVIAKPPGKSETALHLAERHVAGNEPAEAELRLQLVLEGKEDKGLSRAERQRRGLPR